MGLVKEKLGQDFIGFFFFKIGCESFFLFGLSSYIK